MQKYLTKSVIGSKISFLLVSPQQPQQRLPQPQSGPRLTQPGVFKRYHLSFVFLILFIIPSFLRLAELFFKIAEVDLSRKHVDSCVCNSKFDLFSQKSKPYISEKKSIPNRNSFRYSELGLVF